MVEYKLTRGYMYMLWSTKDLLVWDERYLLVFHHRMNHCTFNFLLGLSNKGITPRNLREFRTPPCGVYIWKLPLESMEDQRQTLRWINQKSLGNHTQVHDVNLSDVIYQPSIIPQVTESLTHDRFWSSIVFVDH